MGVNKTTIEKEKAIAFVNWTIANGKIRSSKGFTIFDNIYTTKSDRTLVELAKKHNGDVRVMAELRIVLANTNDDVEVNLDDIEIIVD